MPQKRAAFCEIYVEGYGNGLNEMPHDATGNTAAAFTAEPESIDMTIEEDIQELHGDSVYELPANDDVSPRPMSENSPITPPGMSRESSVSSSNTTSSDPSYDDEIDPSTTPRKQGMTLVEILRSSSINASPNRINDNSKTKSGPRSLTVQGIGPGVQILDNDDLYDPDQELPYVHFTTETWDELLQQSPVTAPKITAVSA